MSIVTSIERAPSNETLGIYIHWPFCVVKCPYCDFNSHVRKSIDENHWQQALRTELENLRQEIGGGRVLETIYFGGGTPSLMTGGVVADVIATAKKLWPLHSDIEITLEANPGTFDVSRFTSYADAGVTRLSLGVQSIREHRLKYLGRIHGAGDAIEAVKRSTEIFDRVSFDLIYGLPIDTLPAWEEELEEALMLAKSTGVEHGSFYQLVIEKGTMFHGLHQRGALKMLDGDVQSDFFERTNQIALAYDMHAYEVSNYAKGGDESCMSLHNLRTWRYQDYAGIGPGAHSRLTIEGNRYERKNWRLPEKWLSSVQQQGNGIEQSIALERSIAIEESLMMGLRLVEGVSKARFFHQFGIELAAVLDQSICSVLVAGGDLIETPDFLKATPKGLMRLDSVVLSLVDHLQVDHLQGI